MPTFHPKLSKAVTIADGVYIAKIVAAKEKISANGNAMLVLKLRLHTGAELQSVLTFVPAAERVITAFCESAGLLVGTDENAEVNLSAGDVLNRYLYVTVVNDCASPESDPAPRVARFLTREAAIAKNPQLARVAIREQLPLKLEGEA